MVHANALLIGEAGVLLRGPSGSGKSALTLDLLALAAQQGVFARLIGDDRVELVNRHGRLIARPHKAIAGAIEERGVGVVRAPCEPAGVIRCVVDLIGAAEPAPQRYPPEMALETQLCGVALPRLRAKAFEGGAARKIFSFIREVMAN
ncbi:MAG: aldolase [Methylocystis sp.]|nr:aldolase [Methylocystis sp.]MBI3274596.1 aldolase [Methylocystis sp.]